MFVLTDETEITAERRAIKAQIQSLSLDFLQFLRGWSDLAVWMLTDKCEGLTRLAFNGASRDAMQELADAQACVPFPVVAFQRASMDVATAWATLPGQLEVPLAESAAEAIAHVTLCWHPAQKTEMAAIAIQRYLDSRQGVHNRSQRAAVLERLLAQLHKMGNMPMDVLLGVDFHPPSGIFSLGPMPGFEYLDGTTKQ